MKKDIVYIDIEDDITAIIGKVKLSKEKIVALVPPKRVGVLQSAVNLRLLQRAAEQTNKRIVLITGNQALTGLAAAASIPVARNLQSKPEVAQIPALDIDDGDDVIDGAQLPIGEHANSAVDTKAAVATADKESELIKGIDIEGEPPVGPAPASVKAKADAKKSGAKVPNFNTFRKRFILIVAAVILLVGGLVWALVFAPAATIVVTARTTDAPVNDVVRFGNETDAEQGVIRAVEQMSEEDVVIEFEATGEKDVGDKATGTVRFTNNSQAVRTVAAGTTLTASSGGLSFILDDSVSIPAGTISCSPFPNCSGVPGSTTGKVTAAEGGNKYNAATGSLSGTPANVSAAFMSPSGGGTSEIVPVVTSADVQRARQALADRSTDEARQKVSGEFNNTIKPIEASFSVSYDDIKPQPAINGEAEGGKAALRGKATYKMHGIAQEALNEYLEQTIKQQMQDQTAQRIYSTDADKVELNDFARSGETLSVRIVGNGQIGPVIEESEIIGRVAGKRYGDIREDLMRIEGVSDVEVKFSYFWVRSVPSNHEKITVEFDIQNAGE